MIDDISIPIYHIILKDMIGDTLYPLNQIKDIYPDVYKREARKYKGREWVMDIELPELGCKWNDVLHFTSINPELIENELRLAEYSPPQADYFKLDLSTIRPDNYLIYHHPIGGQEMRTNDIS